MAISSLGLGSGLDIRSMVDGLVAAEREPQSFQLTKQETSLQAKLSSYGIYKSALSDFRASFAALRREGEFGALKATSSDDSIVSASVSSSAEKGKYSIEAKQLAQSHSLASAGFADANATVGTGTLTIKLGTTDYDSGTDTYSSFVQNPDKGILSIDLDASNNTLTGLRDAINNAEAGVTASIINDGSAYRLVLSSDETGAENSIQISVSDPSLSQFEFNELSTNMEQTQVAQDAIMGINGLDVANSSNTFSNTIKGVSINLHQVEPGKLVNLTVAGNTGDVVSSLQKFVDSFNELNQTVKNLAGFNAANTEESGVLLGDATVRTGMSQIRSVLGDVVSGLQGTSIRTLNDLGVSTQADGSLEFDSGKLTSALESDPDGVAAVFSVLGRPDREGVTYFSSEDHTKTGDYSINVTQPATQGTLVGSANSISSLIINAGTNDTFKIKVDGNLSAEITLSAGTYSSGDELAAEIQARINGDSSLKNKDSRVQVSFDSVNNRFNIVSGKYGSDSSVEIIASTATDLGLEVAAGTDGTDVEGTIGGVTAKGEGQYLTSKDGLKLFIEGDLSGNLGNVNFSRGLMEKLDRVLGGLLDSDGALTAKTKGLQKSLDDIGDERLVLNERMAKYEERLLAQFNAMDALLGQIQGTSSFLSQQLATLPYNNLSKG